MILTQNPELLTFTVSEGIWEYSLPSLSLQQIGGKNKEKQKKV